MARDFVISIPQYKNIKGKGLLFPSKSSKNVKQLAVFSWQFANCQLPFAN